MRVLFFGTPGFAVHTLEALARVHTVRCVTRPDRPVGRHATLTASPVAAAAERLGIPCQKPEKLDDAFLEDVRAWNPDVGVLTAYGKLIKPALLALPRKGFLNVHPSLLPRHRGASPITSALLSGDRETGVTIMLMDEGLDTGPVIAARTVTLAGTETCGDLTESLARVGADLLIETLEPWMNDSLKPITQDDTQATVSRTLTRDDGRLDWTQPAEMLERTVRAYDPWPGTFTEASGTRLKILRARLDDGRSTEPPGTVLRAGTRLLVVCGDGGTLDILELQAAGKKPMKAEDFLRGSPASLTRFG